MNLCSYGCGKLSEFMVGRRSPKPCCSRHYTQCPAFQAKRRKTVEARGGFSFQKPQVKAKAQARIQELFGVDNVGRLGDVQQRIKETNLVRFGAENVFSSEQIKAKIRRTMVDRYGAENPSQVEAIKDRRQATFDERFGGNPQRDPEVQAKTRRTNEERYGGPAPLCDPSIMRQAISKGARSGVRLRPFTFPSGREVMVQGYEPEALELLLLQGYMEADLQVGKDVPVVHYTTVDEDQVRRRHYYHADIFIPGENRLIEVKSLWTFQRGKCADGLGIGNLVFERNLAKKSASQRAGFSFNFMLKHEDGHWSTF